MIMEEIYETLLNNIIAALNNNTLTNDRLILDDLTPSLQKAVIKAVNKGIETGNIQSIIGLLKVCDDHLKDKKLEINTTDNDITVRVISTTEDINEEDK